MNDKQRDYLIKRIDSQYKHELDKLEGDRPKKPSLNNYLIASFLDDSIQFADIKKLKEKMKAQVLKMGHSDVLVTEGDDDDDWYGRRNRRSQNSNTVKVRAEDLFVLPKSYVEALEKYNKELSEWQGRVSSLEALHTTLETKVRLGSSASLDSLIEEADNLVDLSIINNQLTISSQKKLENKKG